MKLKIQLSDFQSHAQQWATQKIDDKITHKYAFINFSVELDGYYELYLWGGHLAAARQGLVVPKSVRVELVARDGARARHQREHSRARPHLSTLHTTLE